MLTLDHTIISDAIADTWFSCDLQQCKGACCVEGDAGAPLNEDEISLLENHIHQILPFMLAGAQEVVIKRGVFDYDAEGRFVTPLVNDRECAFCFFEDGVTRCAVEKACHEGIIPFMKPVSCHLYPIRISLLSEGREALNYHKWHICQKALEKGYRDKTPLYMFLQDSLIRKYGRSWYNRLLKLI